MVLMRLCWVHSLIFTQLHGLVQHLWQAKDGFGATQAPRQIKSAQKLTGTGWSYHCFGLVKLLHAYLGLEATAMCDTQATHKLIKIHNKTRLPLYFPPGYQSASGSKQLQSSIWISHTLEIQRNTGSALRELEVGAITVQHDEQITALKPQGMHI